MVQAQIDTAPQQSGPQYQKLGERLIAAGVITDDQLEVALREQRKSNKLLGEVLVSLGFMTEATLAATLAEGSGFPRISLKNAVLDSEIVTRLPKRIAQRYGVLPVDITDTQVHLAMADIYDIVAIDQVKRYFPRGKEIAPMVAAPSEIMDAIDAYYGYHMSIDDLLNEIESGKLDGPDEGVGDTIINPTVRFANAIILDAVKARASDIHFEPEDAFVRLRYRLDGVMTPGKAFHKQYWASLCTRLKIMAGMDIAESRVPQDGRFTFHVAAREVDFRVASHPTIHGENIVLRILDKTKSLRSLESLGYDAHTVGIIRKMMMRPEGMVIVTGPTGSGKTTTMYSLLSYMNSIEVNIMTLEEPVEYRIARLRQTEIRDNLSFAQGIRSILRQDPDIIFVGEVRDEDTAVMSLRAAMSGHRVFTTLHTNDSFGAVDRLIHLGLSNKLLAGNISGVLAQRLLRTLCPNCKKPRPATREECKILAVEPDHAPTVYDPVGCARCGNIGYKGRMAIVEVLPFSEDLDELVRENASRRSMRETAHRAGFVPLIDNGAGKVLAGDTSVQELCKTVNVTDRL